MLLQRDFVGTRYRIQIYLLLLDSLGRARNQVWKDVDGVLTCDPNIYSHAKTVPDLTFEEVTELAYFGAQVLHPQLMIPAREGDITVRVENSYNCKALGTLITRQRDINKVVLTSIVLKSNVTMLDIVSTRMLGQYVFLARVFSIFEDLCISVDCVATSEVRISVSLDPSKILRHQRHNIGHYKEISTIPIYHQSIKLTLPGNNRCSIEKVHRKRVLKHPRRHQPYHLDVRTSHASLSMAGVHLEIDGDEEVHNGSFLRCAWRKAGDTVVVEACLGAKAIDVAGAHQSLHGRQ
uniref:Aspartate/glutamate/uridylate kinase domain-containing protein n=1 Tax=Zea mays TaxID=4577 RepID=A0A804PWL7_MAIZE